MEMNNVSCLRIESNKKSHQATFKIGIAASAVMLSALSSAVYAKSNIETLYSFDGPTGNNPLSLAQSTDGNFYGVTFSGGMTSSSCPSGCGVAFSITPAGSLSLLHTFTGDISGAPAGLTQSSSGVYYGGNVDELYSIGLNGDVAALQSLWNSSAGYWPSPMIQAADGSFYGVTHYGGGCDTAVWPNGCGAMFRLDQNGGLTTLYQFNGTQDGSNPIGPLLQGADGAFYGTATFGGNITSGSLGYGTLFKYNLQGQLEVLHAFNISDGANPTDRLIQASDGSLYGITLNGAKGYGEVFRLSAAGAFSILHSFTLRDGAFPKEIILGSDGNIYGVTSGGGTRRVGVLFQLSTSGAYKVLADFKKDAGGLNPVSIIQSADGVFYGVASGGGQSNLGTVWRYTAN